MRLFMRLMRVSLFVCLFSLMAVAEEAVDVAEPAPAAKAYVLIRCLYGDGLLYQKEGSQYVHFSNTLGKDDQRAHWVLEEAPEGTVRIINRVTGDGMNVEGQAGFVEVAPVQETFVSFRWNIIDVEDYKLIQNAWQEDQYISLEDQDTDMAGYEVRHDEFWSLRFFLEPVAE